MNITYTRVLGRKIFLVLLLFTFIFSITAWVIRNNITQKLQNVSRLVIDGQNDQSKPEDALLLLHEAEDEFQESLLNIDSKKNPSYKTTLSKAFNEIDILINEHRETKDLSKDQATQIRYWYKKKTELSDRLYVLKHSFDSLLTVYADFRTQVNNTIQNKRGLIHSGHENFNGVSDTIRNQKRKKGLLKRLKDAIVNKNDSATIEIRHKSNVELREQSTQKITVEDRKAYTQKLQQLHLQNVKLLAMQRELILLNTHIINELELIINNVKDINYNIADSFKKIAFKNYKETTDLLNKLNLINFFLVIGFAISLIAFVAKLNKSELLLRSENERLISAAQKKIDELINMMSLSVEEQSSSKIEEIKEIVQLVMSNNPAFMIKFNEFDPNFSKNLLRIAPNLVATEIEFCVLLRLNFGTKEIARYTKTSVRSVEGRKYRVRKKLDIPSDQDINIWMNQIGNRS